MAFDFPTAPSPGDIYSAHGIDWLYTGYLWRPAKGTTTAGAPDTIPDAFAFPPKTGQATSTQISSDPITVSGINTASPLTITGGQYSINGGAFASVGTTVVNGNTVVVRVASSANYDTTTSTTLTIGGVSATFTVRTLVDPTVFGPFTLAWTSAITERTNLTFTLSPALLEGDVITIYFDDNLPVTTPFTQDVNTISAAEAAAGSITFPGITTPLPKDVPTHCFANIVRGSYNANTNPISRTLVDAITLNALTLSANTIVENSLANTVVGAVVGSTAGSSLALMDTAGSRFALAGANIVAGSEPTDYETATSHNIIIRETLAGATNTPRNSGITVNVQQDVSLPALTLPTGTKTGSTAATLTVSTNDGTGTWYGVSSAALPTTAQIKAGQDSTGAPSSYSFNQPVTATGVQTKNATTLTPSTAYTMRYYQEDAEGNASNIASASAFTTDAAGGALVFDITPEYGTGTFSNANKTVVLTAGEAIVRLAQAPIKGKRSVAFNIDASANYTGVGLFCPRATPVNGIGKDNVVSGAWLSNTSASGFGGNAADGVPWPGVGGKFGLVVDESFVGGASTNGRVWGTADGVNFYGASGGGPRTRADVEANIGGCPIGWLVDASRPLTAAVGMAYGGSGGGLTVLDAWPWTAVAGFPYLAQSANVWASPLDATTPAVWWVDASHMASLSPPAPTNGTVLTQINDLGTGGRHMTKSTVYATPGGIYLTNVLNGKPGIFFSSSTTAMITAAFTLPQPFMLVMIWAQSGAAPSAWAVLFDGDRDQSVATRAVLFNSFGAVGGPYSLYGGTQVSQGVSPTINTPYNSQAVFNGANSSSKLNASNFTGINIGTGGIVNGLSLGSISGNNIPWAIICEAFVIPYTAGNVAANAPIDAANAAAYTMAKWGI